MQMTQRTFVAAILAIATPLAMLSGILLPESVSAKTITGVVVAVLDGDTISVLDAIKVEHRIRLTGIDAPYMQVIAIRSR